MNILIWTVTCAPLAGSSTVLSWQVALSGVYVAVCALITIVAVATYSETRHRNLAEDHGIAGTKPWSGAR